ncbi:MAG: radical SAM protein, partial [Clostridiaceae bacterium]|nr:radical SAM protein [Clostridiaceae bacterium]
ITIERLSDIFIELQNKGANNINLVTPSHYVPQIIAALDKAKNKGLLLPIVYNTSGYEKVETIKALESYVDIYLPDFKYFNSDIGKRYSNCPDYFSYASATVEEMVRQKPNPVFDERGMMKKGVIVRHLMLPGYLEDSKSIIKYLYKTFNNYIYISVMNQYTPLKNVSAYPEINRKIAENEYDELVDYAISLGVENGFIQEGETASESFIPDFSNEGV